MQNMCVCVETYIHNNYGGIPNKCSLSITFANEANSTKTFTTVINIHIHIMHNIVEAHYYTLQCR